MQQPPAVNASVVKNLQELLTYHESLASALRVLVASFSVKKTRATSKSDGALASALQLDATRRQAATTKRGKSTWKQTKEEGRKRTAAALAAFNENTPVSGKGKGHIGSLIHNGYLKRKGKGYVRTGKQFAA